MKIKFIKTHPKAEMPKMATVGAAGYDLTAATVDRDIYKGTMVCDTGIAMEIPNGYVGLVFPRGSIHDTYFRLSNSVGVVDSDYRGSIKVLFRDILDTNSRAHLVRANTDTSDKFVYKADAPGVYAVGDRCAQLVIVKLPVIEFYECKKLSTTERGTGMLGSTGRKAIDDVVSTPDEPRSDTNQGSTKVAKTVKASTSKK